MRDETGSRQRARSGKIKQEGPNGLDEEAFHLSVSIKSLDNGRLHSAANDPE